MALTWWDPDTYLDAVAGALAPVDWGDQVKDDLKALYNPPQVQVTNSDAVSVANLTIHPFAFTTENYDPDGMHSSVSNTTRLTAVRAGVHHISGRFVFSGSAGGSQRAILFRLNGTTTITQLDVNKNGSLATAVALSEDYKLAVNDYIELCGYQDSGAALTTTSSPKLFSMRWVGSGT